MTRLMSQSVAILQIPRWEYTMQVRDKTDG